MCHIIPDKTVITSYSIHYTKLYEDAVLAAMRRGYTTRDYLSAVERARTYLDMPAFTTDIIVGFPGEKEARNNFV